jgi:hypothetical protein
VMQTTGALTRVRHSAIAALEAGSDAVFIEEIEETRIATLHCDNAIAKWRSRPLTDWYA